MSAHAAGERQNRRLNPIRTLLNKTPLQIHGPNLHGRPVHLPRMNGPAQQMKPPMKG